MKKLKINSLSLIPNVDGYEFIGIEKSDNEVICKVKKCPITGLHFIQNIDIKILKGWVEWKQYVTRYET